MTSLEKILIKYGGGGKERGESEYKTRFDLSKLPKAKEGGGSKIFLQRGASGKTKF